MRETLWTVAHTSGAKIYSIVLAFATLALTARWLGPAGRGQVVAITTWVSLFGTLGHFSLGQVAIHRATMRKDQEWLGEVLGSLLLLTAIITMSGWIVVLVGYLMTGGKLFGALPAGLLALAFAALPLYIWEQYGSSLLMLLNQIGIYNRFQVIGRTIGLVALVAFVAWWSWGIWGAILATMIGQLLVAVGGLGFLRRQAETGIRATRYEIRGLLKGGIQLHLNAIGVLAFGSIDILILNYFRGPEEAGYYQLAVQLIGVILIIPQAASMVMYGKVATLGPDVAWPVHKKMLNYVLALVTVGAAVAWVLASWIIPLVAGEKFMPAVEIFRWLLLAAIGMTYSTLMAAQWIGRGFFLQAALITVAVGALGATSNLFLVPRYGMLGAAWSVIAAYAVSTMTNIGMVMYCNKRTRLIGSHV